MHKYIKFSYHSWIERETNLTKEKLCKLENKNLDKDFC